MVAKLTSFIRINIIFVCITLLVFGCNDSSHLKKEETNPRLFNGKIVSDNLQKQVNKDYQISFPLDHLPHREYSIEWWYLTANLFDSSGNQYPIQWTLFRSLANNDTEASWSNNQMYMAHAKLITQQQNWFEERFARGGVGNAGVELAGEDKNVFSPYLDDWIWQAKSPELLPASLKFSLNSSINVALSLDAQPNYVAHGENGYSEKLANGRQASMYYSEPFIQITGTIEIPVNDEINTIDVAGNGWFDHEWSSQLIDQNSRGWDWFSLHFEDGRKLMLFNMRHAIEGNFWSGSLIQPDGLKKHLLPADIEVKIIKYTELNGRNLPLDWQIKIPDNEVDIVIKPFKPDQWSTGTFEYYEGAVNVSGSSEGHGFIELTGY